MSVRPRVVVIGSGFGGLNTALHLSSAPLDVVVVDRDNYHGFWPLLYQVATAGLGPDDIAHPIRSIYGPHRNIAVRVGTVSDVDLASRTVYIDGEPSLHYDFLVLAAGTSTNDFGIPGMEEHAFPLKTLPDAVRLRNHILATFEHFDADPAGSPPGALTVVLGGGGPTGVELAGALSELIGRNLAADFPNIDLSMAKVVLVEMTDHLLPGFSDASRAAAMRTLQHKGVEVRLNTKMSEVSATGVSFEDGSRIDSATVVWTAGVRANPLAQRLDTDKGKGGSLVVRGDLSLPTHPEVFVVGDLASAASKNGQPVPQLAQAAIQAGRHTARNIRRILEGKPTKAFNYRNHGIMATIGRRSAVAELPGGILLAGTVGWLSWLGVHLVFLVGFRNRVVVMVNWAWNYLTWDRASRVILGEGSSTPTGQHRA